MVEAGGQDGVSAAIAAFLIGDRWSRFVGYRLVVCQTKKCGCQSSFDKLRMNGLCAFGLSLINGLCAFGLSLINGLCAFGLSLMNGLCAFGLSLMNELCAFGLSLSKPFTHKITLDVALAF